MLLASTLLAMLVAAAPAATDAQQRWDHADALASEGRHDEAVAEYARAWQDLHAPAILYSWAQSERLRGHCTEAAALYERFVAEGQTPPAGYDSELLRAQWSNMLANAERQQEACREPADASTNVPTDEPTDAPKLEPADAQDEPDPELPSITTSPPVNDVPPLRPWSRDATGWSLVATGSASLVAGATLVGVAAWEDGRAEDLGDHQDFRDAVDRAIIEQRIGFPLLGLGGALALGGVVRFIVVARRNDRPRATVSLRPNTRQLPVVGLHPTGRGLVVHGRF
jgi:hypothetical protein